MNNRVKLKLQPMVLSLLWLDKLQSILLISDVHSILLVFPLMVHLGCFVTTSRLSRVVWFHNQCWVSIGMHCHIIPCMKLLLVAGCVLSMFREWKIWPIHWQSHSWFSLKIFVELLLPWKGNAVDAPSGTSNPKGSDTGPGLTVLEEQPSHEQDPANVNEQAIPAVPCGDQCTALHGIMPTDIEFSHGM